MPSQKQLKQLKAIKPFDNGYGVFFVYAQDIQDILTTDEYLNFIKTSQFQPYSTPLSITEKGQRVFFYSHLQYYLSLYA